MAEAGRPIDVLAVGQTPPPWGGQAVMIDAMLRGRYERVVFHGVRMGFSRDMDEVGKPGLGKLFHLAGLVLRIAAKRLRTGARVLYYPPAGPERVPFYRDVLLLLATRWMFDRVVYHMHAGGLGELYDRLSAPERALFRLAYGRADQVIRLSPLSPADDEALRARRSAVVAYGIPDHFPEYAALCGNRARDGETPRLLFVAVLRESKGLDVLLEAARELVKRGVDFELDCLGRFDSAETEAQARSKLHGGLERRVRFPGVVTGARKWDAYARADVFCLPSFFESEALPIVVLEAMQFALPVVATRWRGIPFMVEPGRTGELVPIRDPLALADALEPLLSDAKLRRERGAQGRARYGEHFTVEQFHRAIEAAIVSACDDEAESPRHGGSEWHGADDAGTEEERPPRPETGR